MFIFVAFSTKSSMIAGQGIAVAVSINIENGGWLRVLAWNSPL